MPVACYSLLELGIFRGYRSFWPKTCNFAPLARNFCLNLAIFGLVVRHFRYDLAIFHLSIYGPVDRHFRFDLKMFALRAHHFRLDHSNFAPEALHFC